MLGVAGAKRTLTFSEVVKNITRDREKRPGGHRAPSPGTKPVPGFVPTHTLQWGEPVGSCVQSQQLEEPWVLRELQPLPCGTFPAMWPLGRNRLWQVLLALSVGFWMWNFSPSLLF